MSDKFSSSMDPEQQGNADQDGAQCSTLSGAAPEAIQELELTVQEIRAASIEQLMLIEILREAYVMGRARCILQLTGQVYKY